MREYFKISCLPTENRLRLTVQIKATLGIMGELLPIQNCFVVILDDVAPGMTRGVGTAGFLSLGAHGLPGGSLHMAPSQYLFLG